MSLLERARELGGHAAGSCDGEPARVRAGATGDVSRRARAGQGEARFVECRMQPGEMLAGNEAQQHVLLDRGARLAFLAEFLREVGKSSQLRGSQIAQGHAHRDRHAIRIALGPHIGPREFRQAGACGPCTRRARRTRRRRQRLGEMVEALALFAILGQKRFGSDGLDDELEPRLVLVLAISGAVEHVHHRFGDLEHVLRRRELVRENAAAAQR